MSSSSNFDDLRGACEQVRTLVTKRIAECDTEEIKRLAELYLDGLGHEPVAGNVEHYFGSLYRESTGRDIEDSEMDPFAATNFRSVERLRVIAEVALFSGLAYGDLEDGGSGPDPCTIPTTPRFEEACRALVQEFVTHPRKTWTSLTKYDEAPDSPNVWNDFYHCLDDAFCKFVRLPSQLEER